MLFNAKKSTVAVTLAVLLLSGFGAMQVLADDDEHEGRERSESHEGRDGGTKGRMLTLPMQPFKQNAVLVTWLIRPACCLPLHGKK